MDFILSIEVDCSIVCPQDIHNSLYLWVILQYSCGHSILSSHNLMRKETATLPKVIMIVGPTTSGKTEWGVRLAKKFDGEVISADSRQIYRHMTVGTAKPFGEWKFSGLRRVFHVEGVPHHLIDFLNPGKTFTAAEFRDRAMKHVKEIARAGKVPMVVGGTGLYIDVLAHNFSIPRIPPNKKLRASFEEKTTEDLVAWLGKLDPDAAASIDVHNKRRIIRALEVCILSGEQFSKQKKKGDPVFNILKIGISVPREVLYERIEQRIETMVAQGLEEEVRFLVKHKYGWNLPSMSGIGYRQFRPYLEGKMTLATVMAQLKQDTRKYAKRQTTWFKRDTNIVWCTDIKTAEERIRTFLSS